MKSGKFFTEIVDLSHEMYDGMPKLGVEVTSFFTTRSFEATRKLSNGRVSFEGKMILMPEHCSTHIDAPRHFDPNGLSVEQLPLEKLVLPGHILDFTHRGHGKAITPGDFEEAVLKSGRPIEPGTTVIAWTGQDKDWGSPGFGSRRSYFPAESAQWLVDRKVTLFGTDMIGLDNPDEWWFPTHVVFLTNGLPVVQQLCNLDRLVGKDFLLVVLPLAMRGCTASPVRAVALVV